MQVKGEIKNGSLLNLLLLKPPGSYSDSVWLPILEVVIEFLCSTNQSPDKFSWQ